MFFFIILLCKITQNILDQSSVHIHLGMDYIRHNNFDKSSLVILDFAGRINVQCTLHTFYNTTTTNIYIYIDPQDIGVVYSFYMFQNGLDQIILDQISNSSLLTHCTPCTMPTADLVQYTHHTVHNTHCAPLVQLNLAGSLSELGSKTNTDSVI